MPRKTDSADTTPAPRARPASSGRPHSSDTAATAGFLVAREELYIDGVRAFNPGDLVPAEHVERFGWHAKVSATED